MSDANLWRAEPFFAWWMSMIPVQISTSDTLIVTLTDQAQRPTKQWRHSRGLDLLKAQIKSGTPGIIVRKIPNPKPPALVKFIFTSVRS